MYVYLHNYCLRNCLVTFIVFPLKNGQFEGEEVSLRALSILSLALLDGFSSLGVITKVKETRAPITLCAYIIIQDNLLCFIVPAAWQRSCLSLHRQ